MTDGRGKLTRYSYTAFGNLKSVINSDSKSESYKYDLSGNTACVTDKTGNNTVYTYDNLGLLLERKVLETGDSISYTYDEVGNRISMEDESGTSTYTYDENNRLLKILKGNTTQISYDYDQVENVTSVTDLKENAVAYTYDKASRMETVSNTGKTTTYTYDENGRRKSITYEGGVSEQYTYDKDNQLTNLENKKPNGSIISEYSYTYDLAGRQLSKTDSYGTTNYDYDKAGRITKVTAPGKTTVYAYDKAGNRISLNETYTSLQPSEYVDEATGKDIQYILKKSDYTYSNSNTLLKLVERMFDENSKELARKTTKYIYDDNGNQLRQSVSHTLPDNTKLRPATTGTAYGDNITGGIDKLVEKTSYTYDGFNRLIKTETVKDSVRTTAEYTYNGDDLRVSKTVKKSDNGYTAEVTNYLYDRQNVILETDANNNVKARYIKGINYIAKIDTASKEA
jgi:YD repeat-containing protein